MEIRAPKDEEFLDEVVQHVFDEFRDTYPFEEPEEAEEVVLESACPSYRDSALLAVEGGKLAGFVLYNSFSNLDLYMMQSCEYQLALSGALGWAKKAYNSLLSMWRREKQEAREHAFRAIGAGDHYILDLVVLPEHRCRGIATALVTKACEAARERGSERIFSHAANPISKRVHEKAGFEAIHHIEPFYADLTGATLMGRNLQEVTGDE